MLAFIVSLKNHINPSGLYDNNKVTTIYILTMTLVSLGNGSYKKVCGFCTFVHTMWKGTKLHREFTSDVHSYKNIFVTFYHLITNNRFVTMHK
jgi:hypothetical protein